MTWLGLKNQRTSVEIQEMRSCKFAVAAHMPIMLLLLPTWLPWVTAVSDGGTSEVECCRAGPRNEVRLHKIVLFIAVPAL
jgi:hypothetical protein